MAQHKILGPFSKAQSAKKAPAKPKRFSLSSLDSEISLDQPVDKKGQQLRAAPAADPSLDFDSDTEETPQKKPFGVQAKLQNLSGKAKALQPTIQAAIRKASLGSLLSFESEPQPEPPQLPESNLGSRRMSRKSLDSEDFLTADEGRLYFVQHMRGF